MTGHCHGSADSGGQGMATACRFWRTGSSHAPPAPMNRKRPRPAGPGGPGAATACRSRWTRSSHALPAPMNRDRPQPCQLWRTRNGYAPPALENRERLRPSGSWRTGASRHRYRKTPPAPKSRGRGSDGGAMLRWDGMQITAWPSSRSARTSDGPLSRPERTASRRAPGRRSSGRRNGSRPSGRTDSPRWAPWSPW